MSETIEKPATEAVDLDRLVRHFESRREILNAKYARHRGDLQMESIIAGQILEIEKMERAFLPNAIGEAGIRACNLKSRHYNE